jgi:uncharacterized protein YgiM (DUF1202 family)
VDALTLPHMAHGTASCRGDRLNVREQPNTASRVVGQLLKGQSVTVWALSGGWMIVQTAEGLTGWASEQYLKVDGELVA